ncbi:hypothetical protein [Bosea sp. ASV33]|uniref:hypothetical protein n=1 Tax=Bosea sp. ASV33 TaxID=2795106 RepID=UPI0018EB566E|nr:hypothetical protein [Bosea sp. ASV33]
MVTTESAIMFAFLLTNFARVLAYLPQIIAIARDEGRAKAVSGSTWSLFFVANLSSALYAGLLSGDSTMMVAFAANAACCAAIVATLCWKRRMVRRVLDLPRR